MLVFGPVPSRRLGQSLGINNIPPKVCSYSCIYCQLGRTNRLQVKRANFYQPEDIFLEAEKKIKQVKNEGQHLDYISFVPDGEPTLDVNLGKEIDMLKQLGIKIAVISNASMLGMEGVKEDLLKADWLSLKIDAVDQDLWHRVDRPHGSLDMDRILAEILEFARDYAGTLVTETMLVSEYNDGEENLNQIGNFLRTLKPAKAYLLVPTRPPAESNVRQPSAGVLIKACKTIHDAAHVEVECIAGDEGEGFFFTHDVISDLLSILAVHPMKEVVIEKLLQELNLDKTAIDDLVNQGILEECVYDNTKYLLKRYGK
jgi:wyosine [tRNA(Phe)-imidazoG37] synthetase (radical SAM superfamily)